VVWGCLRMDFTDAGEDEQDHEASSGLHHGKIYKMESKDCWEK